MTLLLKQRLLNLFSCMFACVLFISNAYADSYTVTYDCGYYTGTPPSQTTATDNTSFTPASTANNCGQMSGATLTGWAVSDTEDIQAPGTPFNWEYDEDKTLTAVWSCYPNTNNECVEGYRIRLVKGQCSTGYADLSPSYLYTIPTVGAFLDPGRTQLMTANQNKITLPYKEPLVVSFDTNAPYNPAQNPSQRYTNISPSGCCSTITKQYWCNMKESVPAGQTPTEVITQYGFIASGGVSKAQQYSDNTKEWKGWAGCASSNTQILSLTGYTFDGWYDNLDGTGTPVERVGCTSYQVSGTLYAHWTPKHYTVTYNKGAHAANGSTNYSDAYDTNTHTGGATFDEPYTVLDFDGATISNVMTPETGYVFVGWTKSSTPTFTNGVLNNQFTDVDYWKQDSALTVYAAYDCDTNYEWNNEHTECVSTAAPSTYSISYTSSITPSGNLPSTQTGFNANDSGTLAGAIAAAGYEFIGWICDYDINTGAHVDTGYAAGAGFTFNCSNNVVCDALWQQTSCDPGQTMIPSYLGFSDLRDLTIILDNNGRYRDGGTTVTFGSADNSVDFGTKCSANAGVPFAPGSPEGSGDYCWCQIINYTIDGDTESASSAPWIFVEYFDEPGKCDDKCESVCGEALARDIDMRTAAYTSYVCAYEISYDLGQHSSATATTPDSTYVMYGETYTLAGAPVADTGWQFNGWSCPNLTGTPQQNGYFASGASGSYTYAGNVQCTAQWVCASGYEMNNGQCVRYTITFASVQVTPDGGLPPPMYVINGGTYNLPPTPTAYGYEFVTWKCDYSLTTGLPTYGEDYTEPSGDGGAYPGNAQFTFSGTHDVVCSALWVSWLYTLTYYATVPTGVTFANIPSNATATYGNGTTTYSYADSVSAYDHPNVLKPLPRAYGYNCSIWSCRQINGTNLGGNQFDPDLNAYYINMQFSDALCETTCVPNTIYLDWDSDGGETVSTPPSCSYTTVNGINGIIQPTKPGYSFDGWVVTGWTCDLSYEGGVDINKQGTTNATGNGSSWSMTFDYGVFQGTSLCSDQQGDYNINYETGYSSHWKQEYDILAENTGDNCWCSLTAFNTQNQPQCNIPSDYYVFLGTYETCSASCAMACSNAMKTRYPFRKAIISAAE